MQESATGARPHRADHARDRTALLNQLMLAGVVLVTTLLAVIVPFPGDIGLFFAGALTVFVMTGVTLAVPWERVPPVLLAVVPAIDILAIGALRLSSATAGFGVLWLFPAMWLAAGFGVIGIIGSSLTSTVLFVVAVLLAPNQALGYTTVLLPLAILAVSVVTFITQRRSNAQRALLDTQARVLGEALEHTRRQEQEVTEVLDAVDFGVVRVEADGTLAVTNEAHGRLQRAINDDGPDAYQPDGSTPLDPAELPLARALRGEAFDHQLVWFGPPDGARTALSVTARRLSTVAGADAGAVVVSSDVTSEMTALRERDELVASVSHELRTPLTAILGYLDLALEDPSVTASVRDSVEVAQRNAERLLGIVGDILSSSRRSEATQVGTVMQDVDIADILQRAVESLAPRARERGVSIDASGVDSLPARVDAARLRQVFDNLLANAIEYNVVGGSVALAATRTVDEIRIVVRDTGIGVTAVDLPRLFQRFYRGQTARANGLPGTGLGLAISRDIVRRHGGDIMVDSSPGEGTTFTVRLPAGDTDAPGITDGA